MKKINESFRDQFARHWLFEMPMHTGPNFTPTFDLLEIALNSNISRNIPIESLGNGLYKLTADDDLIYYFLEQNNEKQIIVSTKPFERGVAVELIGKRQGSAVRASDLYQQIIETEKSVIFSGAQLSTEGLSIWLRLLKAGKAITVYDHKNPLYYKTISTQQEFEKYIKDHPEYERYRYVLSEDINRDHFIRSIFELFKAHWLTFYGRQVL
jgi:hypothetical protein